MSIIVLKLVMMSYMEIEYLRRLVATSISGEAFAEQGPVWERLFMGGFPQSLLVHYTALRSVSPS